MANALYRHIEKGEILVLDKNLFLPEYRDLKFRIVTALDGFGMESFTIGTALYVRFESDGEETRWDGFNISVEETNQLQHERAKPKEAA